MQPLANDGGRRRLWRETLRGFPERIEGESTETYRTQALRVEKNRHKQKFVTKKRPLRSRQFVVLLFWGRGADLTGIVRIIYQILSEGAFTITPLPLVLNPGRRFRLMDDYTTALALVLYALSRCKFPHFLPRAKFLLSSLHNSRALNVARRTFSSLLRAWPPRKGALYPPPPALSYG